jgi:hypothetical protein
VINSGELNVVNAFVTSSPMTLNGGRLTGQGDVGPITANSGTVEPTTNAVRVTGDINLSPQATFKTRAITTISGFLDVTGTVNLAGANLSIEVPTSNALALGGVRRIIVNDGTDPIVGTFNGLPEGAVFSPATDFFFRVSYTGGTGNDITITRVAPPTLAISDVTVTERNSGNTPATFAVTLSYPIANATVTFNFATAGGTAVPGSDFTAIVGGVLSFSPGTTSRTIVVQVNGDTVVEPDETFTVNLSSPVNATIADGQGICTILNDDGATSPTPTATPGGTATPSPTPGGTATPTPTPAKALNIATRLRVEKGDNVMIAGFIITGNASKDVVVRGMGPLLGAFGITDFLADPVLDLRGPAGSILKNNNWKDTQRTQIEGSPLEPGDDRESVIVASLAPDAYTAILTGNNDTTGVGLIEVYDNNAAADSQLGNISTRGLVQGSDSVMIGGFILGGSTNNSRIALRGIGPSLAQFGLNNVLANPTLELHDGNGALLISNDDWQTDTVSAGQLAANGLGLSDSKESGIFTSLPPGPFTAILAGKDGGIGIGLIEIYNLK